LIEQVITKEVFKPPTLNNEEGEMTAIEKRIAE